MSKDAADFQIMMPGDSIDEWEPVVWDWEEVKKPIHFRLIIDYGQALSNGKVGILSHLALLLNSGKGSDIQFIIKGEKIPVHSLILEGGSPVFAAMFEHDMTESSSRTVVVEDIEPGVFRQLLHYLYTGEEPNNIEDAEMTEPLFIAADKYQVETLKDWCSSILPKKLNEDSAVRLLIMAHLHSALWLLEDCIEFIIKKKTAFFRREDFRVLNRNYPDLFFEVTKRMNNN